MPPASKQSSDDSHRESRGPIGYIRSAIYAPQPGVAETFQGPPPSSRLLLAPVSLYESLFSHFPPCVATFPTPPHRLKNALRSSLGTQVPGTCVPADAL